jgi:hypothetical protein
MEIGAKETNRTSNENSPVTMRDVSPGSDDKFQICGTREFSRVTALKLCIGAGMYGLVGTGFSPYLNQSKNIRASAPEVRFRPS